MNREAYIAELRTRLQGLSAQDIEDAVNYVEEYFNEAESEEQVWNELGSPVKFASQIKAESAFKTTKDPSNYRKPHSMLKSMITIFAGICALPIALPLILVAVILILVFGLVLFLFVLSGIIVTACMIYASIATLIASFFYSAGIGDTLMHIGSSLIFLGISVLACVFVVFMIRRGMPVFVNTCYGFYNRHKRGGNTYEAQ